MSRYQKSKTSVDLNEARDDGGLGVVVESAGPYANNLHLTLHRWMTASTPHPLIFTARMLFLMPN